MTECVQKLFLSKEKNIYLDICKHTQHQIDGIRFLYKQFKKKNPAVILNDPSGYGKKLQVISLISALRPTDKPVLILCNDEDEVKKCKEQFDEWSNYINDVETQTKAPFKKEKVYICTIDNVHILARGEWSIMVLYLDNIPKYLSKVRFTADFKIFVTSIDMKENLDLLTQIYSYLSPGSNFPDEINNFKANSNSLNAMNKSVQLDALLEDIVIRRNDFPTPFLVNKKKYLLKSTVKGSKDLTGTKIKRSKRKIDEAPSSTVTEKNLKIIDVTENDNKNELMDIESFIRDQKPISSDGFKDYELYNIEKHDQSDNDFDKLPKPDQDENVLNKTQEIIHEIVNNEKSVSGNKLSVNYNEETNGKSSPKVGIFEEMESYKDRFNFDNISENSAYTSAMDIPEDESPIDIQNPINNIEANVIQIEDSSDDICEDENITLVDTKVTNNGKDKKTFNIDSRITELEEMTLKKFKGSFLDSIF